MAAIATGDPLWNQRLSGAQGYYCQDVLNHIKRLRWIEYCTGTLALALTNRPIKNTIGTQSPRRPRRLPNCHAQKTIIVLS